MLLVSFVFSYILYFVHILYTFFLQPKVYSVLYESKNISLGPVTDEIAAVKAEVDSIVSRVSVLV